MVPVSLLDGETLSATYQVNDAGGDGAVYLLSGCGDVQSCLVGVDNYGSANPTDAVPESLVWTNLTGAPTDLFLVLDGFTDPTAFVLLVDIQ